MERIACPAPAKIRRDRRQCHGWYDFALCGFMASLLSPLFSPEGYKVASLLSARGIFASVLFGWLGDTIGRSKAMLLSVILKSFPTLLPGGCRPPVQRSASGRPCRHTPHCPGLLHGVLGDGRHRDAALDVALKAGIPEITREKSISFSA